jgi:hypothetical protein
MKEFTNEILGYLASGSSGSTIFKTETIALDNMNA